MLTVLPGSSLAQMGKQLLWLPKMSHPIHVQLACGAVWGLVVCSGASLPSEQRSLAVSWETGSGGRPDFFQQDGNCQNSRLAQRPFPSVKQRERFNILRVL